MFGTYSGYVQVLARVLLGSLFIASGVGIVLGGAQAFAGYQGMIAGAGLPMAGLLAVLAIALKIFGGLALAAGFKARYAALGLALFTLLTIVFFHSPSTWGDYTNYLMALKNFSIIGGLLLVANNGAGAMAVKCNDTCKWCA